MLHAQDDAAPQFNLADDSVIALPVVEAGRPTIAANTPASILANPVRPATNASRSAPSQWQPRQGSQLRTVVADTLRPVSSNSTTSAVLSPNHPTQGTLQVPFTAVPEPFSVMLNEPQSTTTATETIEPTRPSTIPYVASNLQPPVAAQQNVAEDCESKAGKCRDIWEQLRSNRLASFSRDALDITPPFDPDQKRGSAEYEDEVTKQTADLEFRSWNGRHGGSLGEGRLADYRWGKVVIESMDGQRKLIDAHRLSELDLCYLHDKWGKGVGLPTECRLGESGDSIRNFTMLTYTWKASGLCHKPLYFEEVALERYGHTAGPLAQPVISGAHFFLNIAILPYKMGIHPPHECIYALGYYRPGDCAPYLLCPVPISPRGALMQAGAVVGVGAMIP